MKNICLTTDSYKVSHWAMYMPGTNKLYSYYESRKGGLYKESVFFGLQAVLLQHLAGTVVTQAKIDQAAAVYRSHFNGDIFNKQGWEYILNHHSGKLPLHIKALPEGTIVPEGCCCFTIENMDPNIPWLTEWVESIVMRVWKYIAVATRARHARQILTDFAEKTCDEDDRSHVPFQLHNFGARACTSSWEAAMSGLAHLLYFRGTDNCEALAAAREYYVDMVCPGASIPATEHSVMTQLGEEREFEVVDRIMKTFPVGNLAMVIDSYDTDRFVSTVIDKYRMDILERNGKIVFRDDSGDPVEHTVVLVSKLGKELGYTTNSKGYKCLFKNVGALWGDGITLEGMTNILNALETEGWASSCVTFGMGGGLINGLTRDSFRTAYKLSAVCTNDGWHSVSKKSADPGKVSKAGRFKVVDDNGTLTTVSIDDPRPDMMQTVFTSGEIQNTQHWVDIVKRCGGN